MVADQCNVQLDDMIVKREQKIQQIQRQRPIRLTLALHEKFTARKRYGLEIPRGNSVRGELQKRVQVTVHVLRQELNSPVTHDEVSSSDVST